MPVEINIKLSSPPHRDIPAKSKIFAQIVIDHIIFAQTISESVSSTDEGQEDCWKLILDCNMWVIHTLENQRSELCISLARRMWIASRLLFYARPEWMSPVF